ncbi:unnamed protein product [Rotaria sp. Silwood2]|nr:unnamed protein product [Rotaria sp. Silwood2]
MPVSTTSDVRDRESERSTKPNHPVPSNNFRILKVRYGNRVERCKYCANATSSNDLEKWVRETFGITNNTIFRLRGEDGVVFILAPIDFENDEIFRLEIDPEINSGCFFDYLISVL